MSRRIAVVEGCVGAPEGPICGMSRRARVTAHYRARGCTVTDDPGDADEVVDDCVIWVGEVRLHVCEHGVEAVEDALLASLRKDADGLVSRHLNRSISLAITRRLMNTRVNPNQMTLAIAVLGLASGFVVAAGTYWAAVAGALLLNAQSILDGVDGELSRLRRQGSKLGEWLDTVSDDLSNLSFFVGATIAIDSDPIRWFGVVGIALYAITQLVVYLALAFVYKSGNLQLFQWDSRGSWGRISALEAVVKRDFFCLAFVFLALVNALELAVVAMAVGALAVAVTAAVTTLRRRYARVDRSTRPAASRSAPPCPSDPPRSQL